MQAIKGGQIKVVLAVIKQQDKFLLATRPSGKIMAGYWEFPGGKVEHGELVSNALTRELFEELGITVATSDMRKLGVIDYAYPHAKVSLDVMLCNRWSGEISAKEEQQLCWCSLIGLANLQPQLPTTSLVIELLTYKELL